MKNKAPKAKWFPASLPNGVRRQRLYIDGQETPYFIDSAMGQAAHRTEGDEHGLFGSGLGPEIRPGVKIAATLGSSARLSVLKHRAEQMALNG